MRVATIPSSWLRDEGRRFDPRPYTGGVVAARKRIVRGDHSPLQDLTGGFKGGIFTHLFSPKRTYVNSPEFGIPFLGASSMLLADLSGLPLLSNRDAESRSYKPLKIRSGMTLISCSGSVGRMAFARDDMEGMASAGDLLKVQPDPTKVPPGYVYAFLSSPIGALLVTGGTYGTIVQHLEAQHVANIPVPRLGAALEGQIDALVQRAATNRTRAVTLLNAASAQVDELFQQAGDEPQEAFTTIRSGLLQARMDAYYFSPKCNRARARMDSVDAPKVCLGDVAEVGIPGIFKRRYAPDPAFGHPYITGGDVFQIEPSSERYLKTDVAQKYGLVVRRGTILVQEAGQLGGLIGRSVLAGHHLDGFAVSNNMFRIRLEDETDAGFLWVLLSSPEGVTLLSRESAGSSIPHTDLSRVRGVRIPWPDASVRGPINELAWEATELRDEACELENEARTLVERAIEEAT